MEVHRHRRDGQRQQYVNWVVVIMFQLLSGTPYSVVLPSMHQLVTTPTQQELDASGSHHGNNSQLIWPGLGQSEYVYSWIVTAYSIGELMAALTTGLVVNRLSYRAVITTGTFSLILAGLLYGLAIHVAMIFIARMCMGAVCGVVGTSIAAYIGASTERYERKRARMDAALDEEEETQLEEDSGKKKKKKKKMPLKDKIFIFYNFIMQIGFPCALGICIVMSQFHQLNPYFWPGWSMVAMGSLYLTVFLVFFREDRSPVSGPHQPKEGSVKPERVSFRNLLVYFLIFLSGYVSGGQYTVMDTLLNPILSDQFGFTIEHTSYFILGLMVILASGPLVQVALKLTGLNNRATLIVAYIMAIVGFFVMSDWQSIGEDPCRNITSISSGSGSSQAYHLHLLTDTGSSLDSQDGYNTLLSPNTSDIALEMMCKSMSTSQHQCFWNPRSRITGELCLECPQRCLSVQRSLTFVQLCIGNVLLTLSIPVCVIMTTAIAIDYTPQAHQGVVVSLMYISAGFARFFSPIWTDYAYEALGKRTYAPMSLMSASIFIIILPILCFYKDLGGSKSHSPSVHPTRTDKYTLVVNLEEIGTTDLNDEDRQVASEDPSSPLVETSNC